MPPTLNPPSSEEHVQLALAKGEIMNTELNNTLRWLAEGAFWAMGDPALFAERIMDYSLVVFGMDDLTSWAQRPAFG